MHQLLDRVSVIRRRLGGVIIGKNYGKITRDILGNNNVIAIGDGSWLDNPKVFIRGNNNKISFGKNCKVIGGNTIFRIEGNNIEIIIGDNTSFRHSCIICAQEDNMSIEIGKDCMISNSVTIRTSDSHAIYSKDGNVRINEPRPVHVGNHVWIASKVLVLKGAKIGDGSIIGANAVVTKDVPENCLVVGTPATIVKKNIRWTKERS